MIINKRKLQDKLTDGFIDYQWRIDNPFPIPDSTRALIFEKYRSDYIFRAKVMNLVAGVMSIINECECECGSEFGCGSEEQ